MTGALAIVLAAVVIVVVVIRYRVDGIESRAFSRAHAPRVSTAATSSAVTDQEVTADLAHCREIAQTLTRGLAVISYAIAKNDSGSLADISDVSENLAIGLSSDGASSGIRSIAEHKKFMMDAEGAAGAEAELSKDAADYLAGDSSVRFTKLRHEVSFAKDAVRLVTGDLRSYERLRPAGG